MNNNDSYNTCHVCHYTSSNADDMHSHIKRKQCIPFISTTSTNAESSLMAQMPQIEQMDQMDHFMEEADTVDDIDMNELNLDEGKHFKINSWIVN